MKCCVVYINSAEEMINDVFHFVGFYWFLPFFVSYVSLNDKICHVPQTAEICYTYLYHIKTYLNRKSTGNLTDIKAKAFYQKAR